MATVRAVTAPLGSCGVTAEQLPGRHPAFSGTSKAAAKGIPELAEWEAHWHGLRVPTANVSAVDLTSRPKKAAKHDDIKKVVRQAWESPLEGTLGSTEDQLGSCDSNRDVHSPTSNARVGTALSDHCHATFLV